MTDAESRLDKLNRDLTGKSDVCSSGGSVFSFPEVFFDGFFNFGIGLVVCKKGSFRFVVDSEEYKAVGMQTVFMPEGKTFRVVDASTDLELSILIYNAEPIKNVIGNMTHSLYLYYWMSPGLHYVWHTGEEETISNYISIIGGDRPEDDDYFAVNERKLVLLSLTYRLCGVFQKKLQSGKVAKARTAEIYFNLLKLIDRYYMKERGVEFYADKLCLTPKYLSGVSKSISGYTVQELVFKAIMRKSISLLDSTDMTVQEISETMNFPNPSSFGTFFKKQAGMSPQKYRERGV